MVAVIHEVKEGLTAKRKLIEKFLAEAPEARSDTATVHNDLLCSEYHRKTILKEILKGVLLLELKMTFKDMPDGKRIAIFNDWRIGWMEREELPERRLVMTTVFEIK
jgi:hypothetical protein